MTNDDTMGFNILDAPWVHEHGVEAVIAEIRRIVGDRLAYLTFDIDCLDPACGTDPLCPCVPTASKEKGPRCTDGIDNDCDGFIDGADPDC